MAKVRVHELAKKYDVPSKDVLSMLSDLGEFVKAPSSTVEPQVAIEERVRRGVGRIVLPVGPFMPNLEESLERFGQTVIKPFADLGP